jgi:hypothetical protein
MDWARILAYFTRMADQELVARNEYLAERATLGAGADRSVTCAARAE